ncbi:MAG: phenylalanine--tRNA ligase subunit beta, partial [Firmicutes bacterium]|nr:phenylalanine--tRNA ligase subunit beta [Bacillota bacterium]
MLTPLKWLRDYVDIDMDAEEFGNLMTTAGLEYEEKRKFGELIENVVVGKIEKIERHPNADKLVVCKLNIGKPELLQIVTGATNVYEGALVPVALDNSRLPGPLHGHEKEEGGSVIKSGELRGVKSEGMLCGPQELGWDDKVAPYISKDGIWLFSEGEDKLGQSIVEAFDLDQEVIGFGVTPNRPDWLSMMGVARDAKAFLKKPLKIKKPEVKAEGTGSAGDYISVEVKNPACRRYTARIITDVKIEQSPWWLQHRLMLAGMRPINNIVDITNFVMLEYGQPLHAFDISTVAGGKIIVDMAKDGDTFTTLDGKERKVYSDTLMINDAEKPIGIAGIMGGRNSEIEETTKTVILESANFDSGSIYKSSKKLNLHTEAQNRYTRGVSPSICAEAADRFCQLVEMVGAGKVVPGSVDIYPDPEVLPTTKVRVSRMNLVCGTNLDRDTMKNYLEQLDMKVEYTESPDVMMVTPPPTRRDMLEEVDYAEEIARMYGYDNIPYTLPADNVTVSVSKSWALRAQARRLMTGMGACEIQTYSFVSPKGVEKLGISEDSWERDFLKLLNPLGEETSVMRTILTPNMLETLARNINRGILQAKAFEIGNTFMPNMIDRNDQPEEELSMCIGIYGGDADFFRLKGMVEAFLDGMGVKGYKFTAETEYEPYHPGRCARISIGDEELGIMGEIHPAVAKNFDIDEKVYICELMFEKFLTKAETDKHYSPLPKFPSTERDIALVVDEDVLVGDLENVIKANGGDILEDVKMFDVYRGPQVGFGKKSIAFNLVYRDPEKTLTDDDVKKVHDVVLAQLESKF